MKNDATGDLYARIVPTDEHPSGNTKGRRTRRARLGRTLSSLMVALFMGTLVLMGVGGSQSANAAGIPFVPDPMDAIEVMLCTSQATAPQPAHTLLDDVLFGQASPFEGGYKDQYVTIYEEYGTSGLFWSSYRSTEEEENADGQSGCLLQNLPEFALGMAADQVWTVSRVITGFTISIFQWATNPSLMDQFSEPLDCMVAGCEGNKGLKDILFLNYLLPIVMLGAVWGAWNGLVKKRTTETMQGGLWMIGAASFALIFMSHPSAIASGANTVVGEVGSTITGSVTSATGNGIEKGDVCYLPDWKSTKDRGNRMAACSMYKAMALTPWSAGQFGVAIYEPLKGTSTVKIGKTETTDLRVAQIDAQTIGHTERAEGVMKLPDLILADKHKWGQVLYDVRGWQKGEERTEDTVGKGDFMMWSGERETERVTIAMASVVASLCLGFLVVVISFSTVMLSIAMILLIMMAPLFLLVGVHPGFGRGIALKWLELLVGTILKRIVLATMLAIVVGMYQIIMESPIPWLSQVSLILAVGIGAIVFRKPMLETLNVVKFGGSSTGMESGLGQSAKRGGSTAAGMLAGGVTAGVMGGGIDGIVKGGFKGAMRGGRSGSPVRAASMGSAAGRMAANRDMAGERRDEREDAQKRKAKAEAGVDGNFGGNGGGVSTGPARPQSPANELAAARALDKAASHLSDTVGDLDEVLNESLRRTNEDGDVYGPGTPGAPGATNGPGGAGGAGGGLTPRPGGSAPGSATDDTIVDGQPVPPTGAPGATPGVSPRPDQPAGAPGTTPTTPATPTTPVASAPAAGVPTTPPGSSAGPRPGGLPVARPNPAPDAAPVVSQASPSQAPPSAPPRAAAPANNAPTPAAPTPAAPTNAPAAPATAAPAPATPTPADSPPAAPRHNGGNNVPRPGGN